LIRWIKEIQRHGSRDHALGLALGNVCSKPEKTLQCSKCWSSAAVFTASIWRIDFCTIRGWPSEPNNSMHQTEFRCRSTPQAMLVVDKYQHKRDYQETFVIDSDPHHIAFQKT